MKRILIIDDDNYKVDRAKMSLRDIFEERGENAEFDRVECLREVAVLEKSMDKYDLLVLDMNFPMYAGEGIQLGAGNRVIHRLNFRKINVPIIVFTSEPSLVKEESESILGVVEFDSSVWDKPKFEKVLEDFE